MHFRKSEAGTAVLTGVLLLIFAVLFTSGLFLSSAGVIGDVSSFSSAHASSSPGASSSRGDPDVPSSSVSSGEPDIWEVFADGTDIRPVDTYRPASVPAGCGGILEETREVSMDFPCSDGLTGITDKSLSGVTVDPDALLRDNHVEKSSAPTVVIYHTHTGEGYEERLTEYYSVGESGDAKSYEYSVAAVGDVLTEALESLGVNVIHITDSFDYPSRSGSFKRSAAAVEKALEGVDNVSLVIDLHRGTLQQTGGDRVKPTVYVNGQRAAQISLIAACDADGSLGVSDWEEKLALSLALNRELCSMSPLLALPVSMESQAYNLHLPYPCIMAEIGTDVNTIEEAELSALLLARAVASLVSE